jgi:hypothetical protein
VGLERGPLSLVSTTEELLGRNSSGPSLENSEYSHGDLLCWPRDTLYPQKLALTSPTCGGHLVGTVGSQPKATEFFFMSRYENKLSNKETFWSSHQLITFFTHLLDDQITSLLNNTLNSQITNFHCDAYSRGFWCTTDQYELNYTFSFKYARYLCYKLSYTYGIWGSHDFCFSSLMSFRLAEGNKILNSVYFVQSPFNDRYSQRYRMVCTHSHTRILLTFHCEMRKPTSLHIKLKEF